MLSIRRPVATALLRWLAPARQQSVQASTVAIHFQSALEPFVGSVTSKRSLRPSGEERGLSAVPFTDTSFWGWLPSPLAK